MALSSLISLGASAAATVGQAAPEITLTDVDGKTVHLSDFKGKHVVLEWNNPNCPFVKKHYDTGNMQSLQKKNVSGDTVWLTINSASTQSREFMANDKLKAYIAAEKAAPSAYLTDSDTKVAREYGAKTTPQMFVINPAGMVVYAGAIDDTPSTKKEDVKTAKNYVAAALEESRAGKAVTVSHTTPYGCFVAYK